MQRGLGLGGQILITQAGRHLRQQLQRLGAGIKMGGFPYQGQSGCRVCLRQGATKPGPACMPEGFGLQSLGQGSLPCI